MNRAIHTHPAEAPTLPESERHTLELAVDRLLAVADPLKVILFGSRAGGQARSSSDRAARIDYCGWGGCLGKPNELTIQGLVYLAGQQELSRSGLLGRGRRWN